MKKRNLIRILRAVYARYALPRRHCCAICNRHSTCFLPYRIRKSQQSALMRELDMIGSTLDHFECPWCGCSDRERHLWLYLQALDLVEHFEHAVVLHFAPEKQLSRLISAAGVGEYIKADLYPTSPDVQRVDMLATGFEAGKFDFVFANHVLEHVDDERQALRELHRVLKPGGLAILQTPYCAALHQTWADPGVASESARFQAYGQEDHVRVFGRDIFDTVTSCGFSSEVRLHGELLADCDPRVSGVNPREPFFMFRKE